MGLRTHKVSLLDTETTGLIENTLVADEHWPHVIEVFILRLELKFDEADNLLGVTEMGTVNKLIKPPIPISEEIRLITGIDDAMVADAPIFIQAADEIQSAIEEADEMVAHNLSFDHQILGMEFRRIGREVAWPEQKTCTVEASEHLQGKRLNLSALHLHLFGEGFANAHRAEYDVRAMARCYLKLVEQKEI
jgi:DNA polymerase III epsilon subunit-like protein